MAKNRDANNMSRYGKGTNLTNRSNSMARNTRRNRATTNNRSCWGNSYQTCMGLPSCVWCGTSCEPYGECNTKTINPRESAYRRGGRVRGRGRKYRSGGHVPLNKKSANR